MLKIFSFVKNYIDSGQIRSVKAKKNILSSLAIRGCGVAISFILVPLTINYVNPERFGIWLTLSSIVAWFAFFDIGLTHGLRNKYAEARAKGEDDAAQIFVSTAYAILAIVFLALWALFMVINPLLDWSALLKISPEYGSDVSALAMIVFTYFCLQFVLKIITTIITAEQEPAKASLIELIGQIISISIVAILVKTTEGSLINLGLALCIAPILALIGANFYFFRGQLKAFRPTWSKVKFSYAKSLFNIGIIFFIIQISGIIQFESANIIISRSFGPTEVTDYNIVYKYFSIISIVYFIFLTPFWSASTEAYQKNDIQWIRNGMKKYNILNVVFTLGSILMLLLADWMYDLWIGEGVIQIGFVLSFWSFVFFNLNIFSGKYVIFLNGISALRLQFLASLISPFIYIALSLLFIKHFEMGVEALFIASIVANFNGFLVAPLQYHMVIIKGKKGIWIK